MLQHGHTSYVAYVCNPAQVGHVTASHSATYSLLVDFLLCGLDVLSASLLGHPIRFRGRLLEQCHVCFLCGRGPSCFQTSSPLAGQAPSHKCSAYRARSATDGDLSCSLSY